MKNAMTITLTPITRRRNTEIVDALRQGIRLRAKSWSKNGRFAGAKADRRANKAAIRRMDW